MEDSNARVQIISLFIRISANRRFYANVTRSLKFVKVSNPRSKTLFFGLHQYRALHLQESTLAIASPPLPPVPQVLLKALPQDTSPQLQHQLTYWGSLAKAASAGLSRWWSYHHYPKANGRQAGISPIPTLGISCPIPSRPNAPKASKELLSFNFTHQNKQMFGFIQRPYNLIQSLKYREKSSLCCIFCPINCALSLGKNDLFCPSHRQKRL